jgi:hypothetical protein
MHARRQPDNRLAPGMAPIHDPLLGATGGLSAAAAGCPSPWHQHTLQALEKEKRRSLPTGASSDLADGCPG